MKQNKTWYFIFGKDPELYSYPNEYVKITASTKGRAMDAFRMFFPDVIFMNGACYQYASVYSEPEWKDIYERVMQTRSDARKEIRDIFKQSRDRMWNLYHKQPILTIDGDTKWTRTERLDENPFLKAYFEFEEVEMGQPFDADDYFIDLDLFEDSEYLSDGPDYCVEEFKEFLADFCKEAGQEKE